MRQRSEMATFELCHVGAPRQHATSHASSRARQAQRLARARQVERLRQCTDQAPSECLRTLSRHSMTAWGKHLFAPPHSLSTLLADEPTILGTYDTFHLPSIACPCPPSLHDFPNALPAPSLRVEGHGGVLPAVRYFIEARHAVLITTTTIACLTADPALAKEFRFLPIACTRITHTKASCLQLIHPYLGVVI